MEVPWHSGTFGISSVQWYTGSTARSPGSPGQQEHRKLQYWAAIPTNSCQSVRGSKKVRKGKELLNDNQKALCLSDSLFKGAIRIAINLKLQSQFILNGNLRQCPVFCKIL